MCPSSTAPWFYSKRGSIQFNFSLCLAHGESKMASQMAKISYRYSKTNLPSFVRIFAANVFQVSNSYTNSNKNEIKRRFSDSQLDMDNGDSGTALSRPTKRIEDVTRIKPKQFSLSFEEYMKLKSSVRTRQRVSGIPFAVVGLGTSSVVSAYMFPEMFDATPENVQLIM